MLENEGFHLHTVIFKEERNISKVGEIFHVESDIFKLQCNECLSEFFDFSQFLAHVGIHLAQTENVNFDDHNNDLQNVSKIEKTEYSCESDFENAIEDGECEIDEQLILENEIKAEPIDIWSPISAVPIELETEPKSGLAKMSRYLCHHCPRVYRRKFSLKRHLEKHGGNARFKCEKCAAKFHRKDLLQRHVRQSCQKSRTSISYSRKSLQKAKVMKGFIPQSITKTTTSQSKAECLRLSCVPSNGEYKCSICLQIYQHKFSIKRHIDQHFAAEFNCSKCDAKFHRRDLLQRHVNQSCKERYAE